MNNLSEDFEDLIFDLQNSKEEIEIAINSWKSNEGRTEDINNDDYLSEGYESNEFKESGTEVQPMSPQGFRSKQDGYVMEGKTQSTFSHNSQNDII
jgi:hypothetical protein